MAHMRFRIPRSKIYFPAIGAVRRLKNFKKPRYFIKITKKHKQEKYITKRTGSKALFSGGRAFGGSKTLMFLRVEGWLALRGAKKDQNARWRVLSSGRGVYSASGLPCFAPKAVAHPGAPPKFIVSASRS